MLMARDSSAVTASSTALVSEAIELVSVSGSVVPDGIVTSRYLGRAGAAAAGRAARWSDAPAAAPPSEARGVSAESEALVPQAVTVNVAPSARVASSDERKRRLFVIAPMLRGLAELCLFPYAQTCGCGRGRVSPWQST